MPKAPLMQSGLVARPHLNYTVEDKFYNYPHLLRVFEVLKGINIASSFGLKLFVTALFAFAFFLDVLFRIQGHIRPCVAVYDGGFAFFFILVIHILMR